MTSGSSSMGSAEGQTQQTLLRDERDRKTALKKQTTEEAEGQTGTVKFPPPLENKRPPTMPAMMPANYKDPADDLPEFDKDDEGYEKVETQTDLNKAVDDISEVDLEGTDKEDEEMDDDDEPMDDKTGTSAGTPASISSSANERTEDKLMDVLGSALVGVRGSEDRRMKDSNSLRDCSVNRTEGVTLITITLKEKKLLEDGQDDRITAQNGRHPTPGTTLCSG